MIRKLLLSTCLVLLAACGGDETPAAGAPDGLGPLPATVEGFLIVDVAEGDVDDEGHSELNFGTLSIEGDEVMVQVSGDLLSSASIPPEGSEVRATLGSSSDEYGVTSYTVTALERR